MLKSIFKLWLSLIVAVVGLVGATEVAAQTGFGISPTANLLKRAGSVVTFINSSWSLGDSSNRIAAVYTSLLDATSLSLGGTVAGDLTVGGNATIYGSSGATAPKFTATSTELGLQVDGRSLLTGNVTTTAGLTPATANTGAIGTDAYPFATGRFGTSIASPAITVTSTGAGITLYNTTDQVTNTETGTLAWASNIFTLGTSSGGSATTRTLRLQGGKATWARLDINRGATPYFSFGLSNNAGETGSGVRIAFTPNSSSGNFASLAIEPNINQSGTASYTGLLINPTQSATGSGEKLLADFQLGGVSQLKIDNAGYIYAGGSYGALAEGDGYYFGDSVRGWRYLTGDDIELRQWHIGGQVYQGSYNGSATTRYVVHDAAVKRSAFSSTVDLRNYTPTADLEVLGTASATEMVVSLGSASLASIRSYVDADSGIYFGSTGKVQILADGLQTATFGTNGVTLVNGRDLLTSSASTDIGTSANPFQSAYFSDTVSTTNVLATGAVTSTRIRATADGTYDVPSIGWVTGEGLTRAGAGTLALTGGGQFLMSLSPSSNASYASLNPASVGLDLGSQALGWRHGFFSGQVSSTSIVASATGTIRYLGVGNQDHSFNSSLLSVQHAPSQTEADNRIAFVQLRNTSSTLDTAISILNDTADSDLFRISAFGRQAPFNGNFGFAPANMAMIESTSGTIMTAGDAVAVLSASGAFRPITGLGFGNVESLDPFGASASTTITNGNMASASLDFGNSAAAGTQDLTITVAGAADGDECQLGVPNALASRASEAFTCFVSAANTITVRRTCVAAIGCGDPGAATVKAGFFSRQ